MLTVHKDTENILYHLESNFMGWRVFEPFTFACVFLTFFNGSPCVAMSKPWGRGKGEFLGLALTASGFEDHEIENSRDSTDNEKRCCYLLELPIYQ